MFKILLKLIGVNHLSYRVNNAKLIFQKAHKLALKAEEEIAKEKEALTKDLEKVQAKIKHCEDLHTDNDSFINKISDLM